MLDLRDARWPWAATWALLLVVLVEIGLHVFRQELPEPVLWGAGESGIKAAQASRIAASGGVDWLVLGASHGSLGISPNALLKQPALNTCGPRVYNGALNGRTFSVGEFLLREHYLPLLRPQRLILAVHPLIVNANNAWMERNTAEFFAAPEPRSRLRRGLLGAWTRFLVGNVYLYRYRTWEPDLDLGFRNGKQVVDEWGYHPSRGQFDAAMRAKLAAANHPYQTIMARYETGGPSYEGLVAILELANAENLPVAVLNMPSRPEFFAIGTDGATDYAAYLGSMERLRTRYGFTWIDAQRDLQTLTDADFRDVDHLNVQGAEKLAGFVAPQLAAWCETVRNL